MNTEFLIPSPLNRLDEVSFVPKGSKLSVKRDDLIHPVVSGNKARKLLGVIRRIQNNDITHIMTMGGNRSNYLHALAYVCHTLNVSLTAIIRGHEPKVYAPTLSDISNWGASLRFVNKDTFKQYRSSQEGNDEADLVGACWLPEGGSNEQAIKGMIEAVNELSSPPDRIFVPVGTGCTALGISLGVEAKGWHTQVIGVVVLKGADAIMDDITQMASKLGKMVPTCLSLDHRFCGKGFGKIDHALLNEKARLESVLELPLDPVYGVKMMMAVENYYQTQAHTMTGETLLWHTGGLQGNRT